LLQPIDSPGVMNPPLCSAAQHKEAVVVISGLESDSKFGELDLSLSEVVPRDNRLSSYHNISADAKIQFTAVLEIHRDK